MAIQHRISFVAPGKVIVEENELRKPGPKEVAVQSICSSISAGSERLIYRGHFPSELPVDSSFSDQQQKFSYPLSYGYSLVGEITEVGSEVSPAYIGKRVFGFKPHQSFTVCDLKDWTLLPADLDPYDACFLANCETAVNIAMDSQPMIGERVAIVGQGIVGLLTASIFKQYPLEQILAIDPDSERLKITRANNGVMAILPEEAREFRGTCDLVVELSGNLSALQDAIDLCRFEGRIVIASWFGENQQPFALNTHFHRMRLRLISSQVSTIASVYSARYDKYRRMAIAMQILKDCRPSKWISHRISFDEEKVRFAYQSIDNPGSRPLQMVFNYN